MFFFDSFYEELKNNEENTWFFNPPQSDITDTSKEENAKIWKRVGFLSLYSRLLNIGCFNGLKSTPLDSVKAANMSEAVHILSLKNSGA